MGRFNRALEIDEVKKELTSPLLPLQPLYCPPPRVRRGRYRIGVGYYLINVCKC